MPIIDFCHCPYLIPFAHLCTFSHVLSSTPTLRLFRACMLCPRGCACVHVRASMCPCLVGFHPPPRYLAHPSHIERRWLEHACGYIPVLVVLLPIMASPRGGAAANATAKAASGPNSGAFAIRVPTEDILDPALRHTCLQCNATVFILDDDRLLLQCLNCHRDQQRPGLPAAASVSRSRSPTAEPLLHPGLRYNCLHCDATALVLDAHRRVLQCINCHRTQLLPARPALFYQI